MANGIAGAAMFFVSDIAQLFLAYSVVTVIQRQNEAVEDGSPDGAR